MIVTVYFNLDPPFERRADLQVLPGHFSTSDYSPGISWPLRALRVAAVGPVAAVAVGLDAQPEGPASAAGPVEGVEGLVSLPAAQAAAAAAVRPGLAQPGEFAVLERPAWKQPQKA
jgi:hypothetical protein